MNRKDFFKRIVIGSAAIAVAPSILSSIPEEVAYRGPLFFTPDLSPSDWQFIESRGLSIQEIAKAFNVPTHIMSDSFTFTMPPLKEGSYKYSLTMDDETILSGNIDSI